MIIDIFFLVDYHTRGKLAILFKPTPAVSPYMMPCTKTCLVEGREISSEENSSRRGTLQGDWWCLGRNTNSGPPAGALEGLDPGVQIRTRQF